MTTLSKHKQALFCNDDKSIADYESAMNQAVQAVKSWLQDDKMYTGGSISQLRSQIAFNPTKDGLGIDGALERAINLVQRDGIPPDAMQNVKVLCSQNAHFSVQKNMAMMGMGFASVVSVPVNDNAQMDTQALADIMADLHAKGNIVACVVATAGTTDAGAIDDLKGIAKLCDDFGAWLHVDAAWGGALLLSNDYRFMLDGIHLADSVTLDFHKHYFQSISCGAFLLKDETNYRFMHYEAEYLNSAYDEEHGVPNLVSKSLQTTRRFDALKLWLTVEALGEELYGSMIDHGVNLTKQVADYGVTRVIDSRQDVQSLKMTTLSPIATLENVQALLSQVLAEAERIKDDIKNGTYTPPID